MVSSALPKARQNFAKTTTSRVLGSAEETARELLGKTLRTAKTGVSNAAAAQTTGDAAQADATQALSDAAAAQATANSAQGMGGTAITDASAAQATANTALANAATAQATADGKVALATASTISSDADATFTGTTSNSLVFHTGTLTADRTITLAATTNKWVQRWVRTGGGAFNLIVNGKNLAQNTWADFFYNGSAHVITAYGTL